MIAPPIGRLWMETERNRTKLYTHIKHSMLTFTSISVYKNNSFYNSEGQKKNCSIRTNINRTTVYICIKQSMPMFASKIVNKNNSLLDKPV